MENELNPENDCNLDPDFRRNIKFLNHLIEGLGRNLIPGIPRYALNTDYYSALGCVEIDTLVPNMITWNGLEDLRACVQCNFLNSCQWRNRSVSEIPDIEEILIEDATIEAELDYIWSSLGGIKKRKPEEPEESEIPTPTTLSENTTDFNLDAREQLTKFGTTRFLGGLCRSNEVDLNLFEKAVEIVLESISGLNRNNPFYQKYQSEIFLLYKLLRFKAEGSANKLNPRFLITISNMYKFLDWITNKHIRDMTGISDFSTKHKDEIENNNASRRKVSCSLTYEERYWIYENAQVLMKNGMSIKRAISISKNKFGIRISNSRARQLISPEP